MIENQRGMSRPGRRDGDDPRERQVGARADAQRDAAAERVARDDHRLAVLREVLDGRRGEDVVVLEHEALARERVRLGEAREVDGERPAPVAPELLERQAPRVRRVGEAVDQQDRRPIALELEDPGAVARQLEAVFDERLAHA